MRPNLHRRPLARLKPVPLAAFLLVAGSLLFGPSPSAPLQRGWRLAHECLQLQDQLLGLHGDNEQLTEYAKEATTAEGRGLLARGRYNLVGQGEWLAVVDEMPQPPVPKPSGLRALVGNVNDGFHEDVKSWHDLRNLMNSTRTSKSSGS